MPLILRHMDNYQSNVAVDIRTTLDGAGFEAANDKLNQLSASTDKYTAAVKQSTAQMDAAEASVGALGVSFQFLTGVVAGVFAGWQIGKVIEESALLNARLETLDVVLGAVGHNAGYTRTEMTSYANEVQKMGITMLESRQTVISMAQAQMDLSQASKLARIAQDAAVIGNMNSSEALNAMIHGLQSAQTDVLRTIGINVNFEDSYKKLGAQIGKNATDLSEAEKSQARMNAVVEAGSLIAGTYEAAMGTAGKQVKSMERYLEDLKVKAGAVFNEALVVGVMAMTSSLKDANGQVDELAKNKELESWGHDLALTMAVVADVVDTSALAIKTLVQEVSAAAVVAGRLNQLDFKGAKAAAQAWVDDAQQNFDKMGRIQRAFDDFEAQRANEAKRKADAGAQNDQNYYAAIEFAKQRNGGQLSQKDAINISKQAYGSEFPSGQATDQTTAHTDALKKKADQYTTLMRQMDQYQSALFAEAGQTEHLTETQRFAAKVASDIANGTLKLTEAQKIALTDKLEVMLKQDKANADLAKSTKEQEQAQKQYNQALDDANRFINRANEQAKQSIADAQFQASLIGKTAEEVARLTAEQRARLDIEREIYALREKYKDNPDAATAAINQVVAGSDAQIKQAGDVGVQKRNTDLASQGASLDVYAQEQGRYQQQLDALQAFEDQRTAIASTGEQSRSDVSMNFSLMRENIERQHRARIIQLALQGQLSGQQLEKQDALTKMQIVGNGMTSILGIAAGHNKTAFEMNKKLSLAKAMVSLPSAVMQSYDNGGGYPWGLIPAGLMLATGLAQIDAINSTSYNGGMTSAPSVSSGGGGGGYSGIGNQPSAANQSGTPSNILSGQQQQQEIPQVHIYVSGVITQDQLVNEIVPNALKDNIANRDFLLFDSRTRQGQVMAGVTA